MATRETQGSMDDTKTIVLEVDSDDDRDINAAIAIRQQFGIMPAGAGNLSGRVIGEICRGWMELLEVGRFKPRDT